MRPSYQRALVTSLLSAGLWLAMPASDALACGGFFCSQSQPVNQAAERIVFAQNDDDTVTAVIQILYEGPSENFSWLLPITSVPNPETDEIAISSDIAFQRLQNATNPNYTLTRRVEGTCRADPVSPGFAGSVAASSGGGFPQLGDSPPVSLEASGIVGSFEWAVISFDPELAEPSAAAVDWLEENGYDVTPEGAALIAPYLEDGMYLLALKLVKGADTGAIRPIVLTYDAGAPMIPIKLTAVAANANMGVMTWLLGEARAVPNNYLALELNEAQINWFNASSNYNDVVIRAAEESGGQGFVTEFAGRTTALANTIWTAGDAQQWQSIRSQVYSSVSEILDRTFYPYGTWDGYWEAVRASVTLPESVKFEDFQLCPSCYAGDVTDFSPSAYLDAIEEHVIEPVRLLQDLFDQHSYTTRLYTTMSAADMTLDPSFTFNGDLGDVSNLHSAERIIECNSTLTESEAPWRIELPQGGVIRGTADQANAASWPAEFDSQPSNLKIRQLSSSGEGMLLTDNSDQVEKALEDYNKSVPRAHGVSGGGCSVARSSTEPSWLLLLVCSVLGSWRRRRSAQSLLG